jgi:hypothetical protein
VATIVKSGKLIMRLSASELHQESGSVHVDNRALQQHNTLNPATPFRLVRTERPVLRAASNVVQRLIDRTERRLFARR